jgi:adenylate cyclase
MQRDVGRDPAPERAVELVRATSTPGLLSTCYQARGERTKPQGAKMMVSEGQRAVQQDPSNGAALGILAGGYAVLGEEERTREWIDRALLIDPDNLNMRYNFSCVLAGHLKDAEGALKMLESVLTRAGAYQVRIAETDPDFDFIRDDRRFKIDDVDATAARHQRGSAATGPFCA